MKDELGRMAEVRQHGVFAGHLRETAEGGWRFDYLEGTSKNLRDRAVDEFGAGSQRLAPRRSGTALREPAP